MINKNIEVFSNNKPNWIGEISAENSFPKYIGKEKDKEVFVNKNDELLLIEDKFDSSFKINSKKRELIFIIGINSIKEIRNLYKKKHKDSYLVVLEPNISLFNYVLNTKDLSVFNKEKIYLFADNNLDNIPNFLQPLMFSLDFAGLIKNISFYFTDYYRNYDVKLTTTLINLVRQVMRSSIRTLGNDVNDSLIGLKQNLENIPYILKSKNPSNLKNMFLDKPAIVVAAGPSLNKNISYLKEAQGKAIIIAVDTIWERLVKEGITPDFVCAIERVGEIYEYFFMNKQIPSEISLVGPPLLDSRVFKEFKGQLILPFRDEVQEYKWLKEVLSLDGDIGILMGLSCAHVAFGFAHHLGCNPIVLVGQDLAYGEVDGETHASGTTYDNQESQVPSEIDEEWVKGYYGEKVKTTHIWTMFRVWYENRIAENNINVVNATEGGAKILHTRNMSLKDVINSYCTEELNSVVNTINEMPNYHIEKSTVRENFENELEFMDNFRKNCLMYFNNLSQMDITARDFGGKSQFYMNELSKIHVLIQQFYNHKLLSHNLQSQLIKFYWDFNGIEDVISIETLKRHRDIRISFVGTIIITVTEIEGYLKEALEKNFN